MQKRIIIADIASIKKDNDNFGHYGKVAKMYKQLLQSYAEILIAGGPVYYKYNKFQKNIKKLPFDTELNELSTQSGKIIFKIKSIINGLKLFTSIKSDIVICQPYSFFSWMIALLFASRQTQIYLIEYRNELDKKINRVLYALVKNKIKGIICPNKEVGKQFDLPYIVVPDYIYNKEKIEEKKNEEYKYDFGMVGIMSKGKDIEEIVRFFSNTSYRIIISGYFEDKQRFENLKFQATSNIILENQYLSEEEYKEKIEMSKYIILPYKDYYNNASSGVIYDILFNHKPVITRDFSNFQFVKEYNVGFLYKSSIRELDVEAILNCHIYDEIRKNIEKYLMDNEKKNKDIVNFIMK